MNSILMHCRVSATQNVVNIKLIGIVHDILFDFYDENKEEELKMNNILNECGLAIDSYYQKLIDEKNNILENKPNDYKSIIERIDFLLNRRVYLNEDIFLIETNYNKESIEKCIHCLEKITINFNKIIPTDLNIKLKNHFTKIKKRKLSLNALITSFKNSTEINNLIKMYQKYDLSIETILNYAKTSGFFFWMKYDKKLSNEIFLQFDYLFNTIKTILRHDLFINDLKYDDESSFKAIGLFKSESEFDESFKLYKKYGIIEWKLLNGICFDYDRLEERDIEECINLWKMFYLTYSSETEFIGNLISLFLFTILINNRFYLMK